MKPTIGLVTIGQSPRIDLTPDLEDLWQSRYTILERGALDDLTPEAIAQLAPTAGETVLVSRLREGGCARMAEERLIPLVQEAITLTARQASAVFLLCTGEFPPMASPVPLFEPDRILRNTVRGILKPGQRLGVIVPEKDQQEDIVRRWAKYIDNEVITDFGSPYAGDTHLLEQAAERLKKQDVDLIVLDCLGYSQRMKYIVKAITGRPVIIPRTLVGRLIEEVL